MTSLRHSFSCHTSPAPNLLTAHTTHTHKLEGGDLDGEENVAAPTRSSPVEKPSARVGPTTQLDWLDGKLGPPISLFHDIFETFQQRADDPPTPDANQTETFKALSFHSLATYKYDAAYENAIKGYLDKILNQSEAGTGLRPQVKTASGQTAFPLFTEIMTDFGSIGEETRVRGMSAYQACVKQGAGSVGLT